MQEFEFGGGIRRCRSGLTPELLHNLRLATNTDVLGATDVDIIIALMLAAAVAHVHVAAHISNNASFAIAHWSIHIPAHASMNNTKAVIDVERHATIMAGLDECNKNYDTALHQMSSLGS